MTFNTAHVLAAHVIVLHCGLCIRWDGDIQGFNSLVSTARPVRAESLVCVCHTKVVCVLVGADSFWGTNFVINKIHSCGYILQRLKWSEIRFPTAVKCAPKMRAHVEINNTLRACFSSRALSAEHCSNFKFCKQCLAASSFCICWPTYS